MKRISPEDKPLTEMEGGKRLWMRAEDMSLEIYKRHLKPTVFNTDLKILTTEHYVPEYLKGILSKKIGNSRLQFCLLNSF